MEFHCHICNGNKNSSVMIELMKNEDTGLKKDLPMSDPVKSNKTKSLSVRLEFVEMGLSWGVQYRNTWICHYRVYQKSAAVSHGPLGNVFTVYLLVNVNGSWMMGPETWTHCSLVKPYDVINPWNYIKMSFPSNSNCNGNIIQWSRIYCSSIWLAGCHAQCDNNLDCFTVQA